jgi:hypothetical protein
MNATIKKIDSSANGVTIASTAGNIDGAATKALGVQRLTYSPIGSRLAIVSWP